MVKVGRHYEQLHVVSPVLTQPELWHIISSSLKTLFATEALRPPYISKNFRKTAAKQRWVREGLFGIGTTAGQRFIGPGRLVSEWGQAKLQQNIT